VKINLI